MHNTIWLCKTFYHQTFKCLMGDLLHLQSTSTIVDLLELCLLPYAGMDILIQHNIW